LAYESAAFRAAFSFSVYLVGSDPESIAEIALAAAPSEDDRDLWPLPGAENG